VRLGLRATSAAYVILVGVTRQVEQGLPEAGLVGVHRTEVRWAFDDDPIAILCRHRFDGLATALR